MADRFQTDVLKNRFGNVQSNDRFGYDTATNRYGNITSSNVRSTIDLDDLDTLKAFAASKGLELDEKKPSLFRRTMDLLSRGVYASAGAAKATIKNIQGKEKENILHEAWKGLMGTEKETYSDVLMEAGVKNRFVKGGVGFALDVVLDPTTYLGGSLVRGLGKAGAKTASGGYQVFKKLTKFEPEIATKLETGAKSIQEAFNIAFNQMGRGSRLSKTKSFVDDLYRSQNQKSQLFESTYDKWDDLFKKLPESEHDAFVNKLIGHRKQLPSIQEKVAKQYIDDFNKKYAKKYPIKDIAHAEKRLKSIESFNNKKIEYLNKKKELILKQGGNITNQKADVLRKQIAELRKALSIENVAKELGEEIDVTDKMVKDSIKNFLNQEELALKGTLATLKTKKVGEIAKKGLDEKVAPSIDKTNYLKEVAKIDQQILKETNELSDKIATLTTISDSRKIAKKQLNEMLPDFTEKESKFFKDVYKPAVDDIAKQAGLEDTKFETYFPEIRKKDLDKSVEAGRAFTTGSKGYLKEYKGKLADDEIIKKPIEALTRREYEIASDKFTETFLKDSVQSYGKPVNAFKNAEEAAVDGYKMVRDKAVGGKEIGWMKKADHDLINEIMRPEMKVIDSLGKASGFDKVTNAIKWFQTVPFPAFHIRNMISGDVQNYQVLGRQALNPLNHTKAIDVMRSADKVFKFKNWSGTAKELRQVLKDNFGMSSRYISDLGDPAKMKAKMSKWNPRRLGAFIEDYQKSKAMITALKKGSKLDEAIKLAEKAGFDYSKITPFEQKVMKRLIPYYTFMRKNAELQISTFAKNPERILNQKKVADSLSNMFGEDTTEEDLEGLPDWVLNGLGFKVSEGRYMSKLGLPLEEFIGRVNDPLGSTLSSLNPIIKYPLEAKLGLDFFRDKEIVDLKSIAPATGEKLMELKEDGNLPAWIDEALNVDSYVGSDGETRYTASPKALHLLRNLPTSRMQNTFEKIFDKDMESVDKWLSFLSGGKIYEIDQEQQKYFKERDLRRDIEDQLLGQGVGSRGEYFYVNK